MKMKNVPDRLGRALAWVASPAAWIANAAASLFADVVAGYRSRLEDVNANARAAAKAQALAQLKVGRREDYLTIAELIADCINNTVELTHLVAVDIISKLFCEPWVSQNKNGVCIFRLRAIYRKGYGLTAEMLERILQTELNRLCGIYQLPSLRVHIRLDPKGFVTIYVAFTDELRAASAPIVI